MLKIYISIWSHVEDRQRLTQSAFAADFLNRRQGQANLLGLQGAETKNLINMRKFASCLVTVVTVVCISIPTLEHKGFLHGIGKRPEPRKYNKHNCYIAFISYL